MRCICDQAETPHHHAFGGTYPCTLPDCRRCASYDNAVWGDRPLSVANRSSFRAARRHLPRKEP